MNKKTLLFGTLLAASLAATTVQAAPCAGFTDVLDTDTFCPNVQWLKNRSITLGCTSSTLYCPTEPVTRLAMAAFMNRLGTALTPVSYFSEANPGFNDLDVVTFACVSSVVPVANYPRIAVVTGHLSGFATAGVAQWTSYIAWNTDGNGVTFPLEISGQQQRGGPVVANTWGGSSVFAAIPIAAGTQLQMAIHVTRDAMTGGTNDLTDSRCQLNAVVYNQNGTVPPFDMTFVAPSASND
jgi:hypothetical protein